MDNQQVNSREGKSWTTEEENFIKTNYIFRDVNSIDYIANQLKRTKKSILHRITKMGITNVDHTVHHDCPMKIKKPIPETAYILGAYLSDGWTNKCYFELHSIDKDYCEAVIKCLDVILDGDYNRVIKEYSLEKLNKNKTVKYTSPQYRIKVRSTDLVTWLQTVTHCKQTIPVEFIENNALDLLSGLMDGDGSIGINNNYSSDQYSHYKITLCGHKYIYGSVKKYPAIFSKLRIRYTETNPKAETFGFAIYNLNKHDVINSGLSFKIKRKQTRLDKLREILNEHHGVSEQDNGLF